MMVIDASYAVKWFVPEDGPDLAERLLEPEWPLIALDLLAIERTNVLLKKHRRREVADENPAEALRVLQSLGIAVVPHGPLPREAAASSQQHRLAALADSLATSLWSPDDVQEHP